MHGLYLSRGCDDIVTLSRELMGMHCWFHRNVVFSAIIRGADITGWKDALTKTWLYRGTLHGVAFDDLPTLLALHSDNSYLAEYMGEDTLSAIADDVIALMEDGVFSRIEMRRIFADRYDQKIIDIALSPWGGIFVQLARQGRVAFRDMTSRDFDLIAAEPVHTQEDVLPELLRRYFKAYGPATIADAAYFLGLVWKFDKKRFADINLDDLARFEIGKDTYYYYDDKAEMADIPEITLLSGFDPLIVSYVERSAVLPAEYKKAVILSSGICLPTIAVNGRVAGLWNIKKDEPVVTFFEQPEKRLEDAAYDMVCKIIRQTVSIIKAK